MLLAVRGSDISRKWSDEWGGIFGFLGPLTSSVYSVISSTGRATRA